MILTLVRKPEQTVFAGLIRAAKSKELTQVCRLLKMLLNQLQQPFNRALNKFETKSNIFHSHLVTTKHLIKLLVVKKSIHHSQHLITRSFG